MIVQAIIALYFLAVKTVLDILPDVPATPQPVTDGADWVIDTVASVASVLQVVYTPALLTALIFCILALISFERIYYLILWVLKKIPALNIK